MSVALYHIYLRSTRSRTFFRLILIFSSMNLTPFNMWSCLTSPGPIFLLGGLWMSLPHHWECPVYLPSTPSSYFILLWDLPWWRWHLLPLSILELLTFVTSLNSGTYVLVLGLSSLIGCPFWVQGTSKYLFWGYIERSSWQLYLGLLS